MTDTYSTKRVNQGFTIVELLIVIVVIGILVMIAIIAYNRMQQRALNVGRVTEFGAWQKNFELYKAANNRYPTMPNGNYCLGTGFPNQTCRNWNEVGINSYPEVDAAPLLSQLGQIATPPSSQRTPANTHIGPYVTYDTSSITFVMFLNDTTGKCPTGTQELWSDGVDTIMCSITKNK